MSVDNKLLNHIMNKLGISDPTEIAKRINHYQEMRTKLAKIEQTKTGLRQDFDFQMKFLEEQIREIQRNCDHYDQNYSPDPSGGSDSSKSCKICLKELQ